MQLIACAATDSGLRRARNEDAFGVLPEEQLFVVADGMGGHSSGEIASRLSVETVEAFYKATAEGRLNGVTYESFRLSRAIQLANSRLRDLAALRADLEGMGTTVVAALFEGERCYIGHVGDSRAYRLRGGRLERLTRDHSLLDDFIRKHDPSPDEIEAFPLKHVVLRALGIREQVEVEVRPDEVRPGDTYLLCSDGLTDMVSDETLRQMMLAEPEPARLCEDLVEAAKEAGGFDNVTVLVVRCDHAEAA